MSQNNYKLVNPVLKGSMNVLHGGTSPLDAAKNVWNSISGAFSNMIPKFKMTLQDLASGKLCDFCVEEDKSQEKYEEDKVDYKITEIKSKISDNSKATEKFLEKVEEVENGDYPGKKELDKHIGGYNKTGGKKKKKHHKKKYIDDSSSSSSSDSEYDYYRSRRRSQKIDPLYYYWYDASIYDDVEYYIPTFTSPLKPYVIINPYGVKHYIQTYTEL